MTNTQVYSHYHRLSGKGKTLEIHLEEVAKAARDSVPSFLHFDVVNCEQVQKLLYLQGLFHDLGKYTDYFQNYLIFGRRSSYQNHAHISALIFYRYLKEGYADLDIEDKLKDIIYFLFYVMIRRHHNKLSTDGLFHLEDLPRMRQELQMQILNLHKKTKILSKLYPLTEAEIELLLRDADMILEDRKFRRSVKRILMHHPHDRWYFLMLYCFSQLVDKDKFSAADLSSRTRAHLSSQWVTDYIQLKSRGQMTKMNDRREQTRLAVQQRIQNISDDELKIVRLFTITAPTGFGKTLTSLQAAFLIAERLSTMFSYAPKIITAIPFINIIEQTKKDYIEILKGRGYLNIHHRMADKRLFGTGREEIPIELSLLEVEAWEGDVIITTFVQFFQSLFTGENAVLKKINKLAGSIVILDEVQSIPEKYMPLVGAVIIKISEYYGTRFILMSATQPYILEMGRRLLEYCAVEKDIGLNPSNRINEISLLPDYEEYYKEQTRTKLIPSFHQVFGTDTFIEFFDRTWGGKSAVVVVNTINRCIAVYRAIKDKYEGRALVYHLSTNLIPIERKRVIDEIKLALDNNKTVILISTQTIEAGVDLDFAVGYRDLAPLESIIQTAGRVNRNGNKTNERGEKIVCPVYIFQLERDHQYIYPLHHLERTKALLKQHDAIEEPDYLRLIDTYYREMSDHLAQESIDLWKDGIQALNFEKVSQFQLIPEDQSVVDVFVEFDDEAEKLADVYVMLRGGSKLDIHLLSEVAGENISLDEHQEITIFQQKALMQMILSKMSEYMVQIRYPRFQKTKPLPFSNREGGVQSSFFWVPRNQIEDFYSIEIGYREVEEARMW